MREAVGARGAPLLRLPPCSPDPDPIEQAFAEIKALLRKAAARTVEELWNATGGFLGRFTPAECANQLANCGYPRSA